uniref:Uncharacterized protein n=1 Tax=Molossus molossus TaxID=27622 RepID=A0A7J8JVD6_MOLMO|nr:hypothetical protein HJG59_007787 [Molossus molossus]
MTVTSGKRVARSKCSVFTDTVQIPPPHLRGCHYLQGTSAHSCSGTDSVQLWCRHLGDTGLPESPCTPEPASAPTIRLPAPSQLRGCGPQITSVSPHSSGILRSQWLGQLHFLFSFQRGISLGGPLKEL